LLIVSLERSIHYNFKQFAMTNQLAIFEQKPIRSAEHEGEMYFSIVDIIEVLTDSTKPSNYWNMLKKREFQLSTICVKLKLTGLDGKNYPSDCANTEGVLRILMSVPSPKAEPFKMWLAQVGKQAIVEIENPELGIDRLTEIYKAKGHTAEWIKNRLQSIETRKKLTDDWKERGVTEGAEYALLTATIGKGTFGLTPSEHSKLKGLERQNLRDHMTPLELIFTALSEEATRIYAEENDAQGFHENHEAADKGGKTAGNARRGFEKETGRKVVSSDNFLGLKEADKTEELPKGE
jgi:DNA-damage-inducible protein D